MTDYLEIYLNKTKRCPATFLWLKKCPGKLTKPYETFHMPKKFLLGYLKLKTKFIYFSYE